MPFCAECKKETKNWTVSRGRLLCRECFDREESEPLEEKIKKLEKQMKEFEEAKKKVKAEEQKSRRK